MSSGDDDGVRSEPLPADDTMGGYVNAFLMWAAREPYTFLFYVLAFLSPFFAISSYLSYKLSKALEKQEREMKKRKSASEKAKQRAKKES